MANRLFEQRVVNPLERPVSEDPNLGFSQDNGTVRTMMQQLYQTYSAQDTDINAQGFIGEGFRPYTPSGRQIGLAAGIGFRNYPAGAETAIGGVIGVNDAAAFKPLYFRESRSVANVPTAPAVGFARRDIIAVRWAPHLTDQTPSRILNPGTTSFNFTNKFKTLSWDLFDYSTAYTVFGGTTSESVTAPILYAPGLSGAYDSGDPDTILDRPLPLIPESYTPVAVINVIGGQSDITPAEVVDYRRRIFPGGVATLYGLPTIGAAEVLSTWLAGQALTNPTLTGPYRLKSFLSKRSPELPPSPTTTHNEYQLTVIGARDARAVAMQALTQVTDSRSYQPSQVVLIDTIVNGVATASDCMMWANGALSPDGDTFAIGQPYSAITFRVGTAQPVAGATPVRLELNTTAVAWNADVATPIRTIQLMLQATLLT